MSAKLTLLAAQRIALVEQSALRRLRLRREVNALRDRFRLPAVVGNTSPTILRFALGLAFSAVGLRRVGRLVAFTGRMLLYTRAARALLGR